MTVFRPGRAALVRLSKISAAQFAHRAMAVLQHGEPAAQRQPKSRN
jgi:hypothetical protein